jgi:adenosine kinase
LIDPTGCGDAFRGGLLYGLENKLDWETTGRLASLMGSVKIAHQGPQNHQPSRSEIMTRFQDAFGYSI